MPHVHSAFTIGNPTALFAVTAPFLAVRDITTPTQLATFLRTRNFREPRRYGVVKNLTLENIAQQVEEELLTTRKAVLASRYAAYNQIVVNQLLNRIPIDGSAQLGNPLRDKYPVFFPGSVPQGYSVAGKAGFDFYSNGNLFLQSFLPTLEEFAQTTGIPTNYIEQFAFIPIHAAGYAAIPTFTDAGFTVQDAFALRTKPKTLAGVTGQLSLFDEQLQPKEYPSQHEVELPDHPLRFNRVNKPHENHSVMSDRLGRQREQVFALDAPHAYESEILADEERYGVRIKTELEKQEWMQTKKALHDALTNTMLALKTAVIIDSSWDIFARAKRDTRGSLPESDQVVAYMGKTTPFAAILADAVTYSSTLGKVDEVRDKRRRVDADRHIFWIGKGIHANSPERIPLHDIVEVTAQNKLLGYLRGRYVIDHGSRDDEGVPTAPFTQGHFIPQTVYRERRLHVHNGKQFPFLLLEDGTDEQQPNLEDVARAKFTPEQLARLHTTCTTQRRGIRRVESSLVELFNNNPAMHPDLISMDSRTIRWQDDIAGAIIRTPHELGLASIISKLTETTDPKLMEFSGSLFASQTMPRIDKEYVARWKEGRPIDIGCGLERQIMRIPSVAQKQLLREQAPSLSDEEKDVLFRFYDPETFEPTLMINGQAVHLLASEPLDGLSHYKTLRHIGMEPTPSSHYTELRVRRQITLPSNTDDVSAVVGFQPDIFLLLDRGLNNERKRIVDLVIGEIKSSGIMIYPKQSYTNQQAFYAAQLTDLIESQTDVHVGNAYLPLLQSAFLPFTSSVPIYEEAQIHPTYRPQRWGPIIRLNRKTSQSYGIQNQIAGEIVQQRRELRSGERSLPLYKTHMEERHVCENCPVATRAICDRVEKYVLDGVPQGDMLRGRIPTQTHTTAIPAAE